MQSGWRRASRTSLQRSGAAAIRPVPRQPLGGADRERGRTQSARYVGSQAGCAGRDSWSVPARCGPVCPASFCPSYFPARPASRICRSSSGRVVTQRRWSTRSVGSWLKRGATIPRRTGAPHAAHVVAQLCGSRNGLPAHVEISQSVPTCAPPTAGSLETLSTVLVKRDRLRVRQRYGSSRVALSPVGTLRVEAGGAFCHWSAPAATIAHRVRGTCMGGRVLPGGKHA